MPEKQKEDIDKDVLSAEPCCDTTDNPKARKTAVFKKEVQPKNRVGGIVFKNLKIQTKKESNN